MTTSIIKHIICCKIKKNTIKITKFPRYNMSNKVPSSLKHNVWTTYIGEKFDGKCGVTWCNNRITPFTFEAGHNVPFSKGGATTIDNLRPICSDCNKSMGNRYTIDEFSEQYKSSKEKIIINDETLVEIISPNDIQSPVSKPNIFNKLLSFMCLCMSPKTKCLK